MNLLNKNSRRRWRRGAAAFVLSCILALSPLSAFASASESEASDRAAAEEVSSDGEKQTTSVTVYYCEIMHYEDPDYQHPSGLRLLDSRTFDGVTVGEEIDPWNYVRAIPNQRFFDGWAMDKIASADPEKNIVQLNYFMTESDVTVNYYLMSAADESDDPAAEPLASSNGLPRETIIEDFNGTRVQFDKLESRTVESQPLGTTINSGELDMAFEDLMYVGADKETLEVSPLASENVINILYAPSLVSLPDDIPAGDADILGTPEEEVPSTPSTDNAPADAPGDSGENSTGNPDQETPSTPDAGNKPASTPEGSDGATSGDSGDAGDAGDADTTTDSTKPDTEGGDDVEEAPEQEAPAPGDEDAESETVIAGDDTPLAAGSDETLTLPQTGDASGTAVGLMLSAGGAALVLGLLRRLKAE